LISLAHVNLRAPQPLLDQLRDFYAEVIGLEVGPRPAFKVFGYWLYAGALPIVHLAEGDTSPVNATDKGGSFSHVAFSCDDLRAMEERLQAARVKFRLRTVPETGVVQIFLTDPAGNGVELQFD